MKNLNDIKTQITTTKTASLIDNLVSKNLKGGNGCPPPWLTDIKGN